MPRILLVDDLPENLSILDALLTAHGYSLPTAPHGDQALALARRKPPGIITDMVMPVMDRQARYREWDKDDRLRCVCPRKDRPEVSEQECLCELIHALVLKEKAQMEESPEISRVWDEPKAFLQRLSSAANLARHRCGAFEVGPRP